MISAKSVNLLAVLLLASAGVQSQQRQVGAIVEKVNGPVILKQANKQIRLNSKSDVGRALYVSDSVNCEKGGTLRLISGSKILELDESSGWYTIAPPERPQFKKVLDAYGRTGGRDRGAGLAIPIMYAPANEGSVAPAQFVVRWAPLKASCMVSFLILDASGRELWRLQGVNGTSGSLRPDTARQALISYSEQKSPGPLQLKLSDTCGDEDQVSFTLLSAANEKSLSLDLAVWERERDELLAHLGRASVFLDYDMFPEAADEYEAALSLAPESQSLLTRTIAAEGRIGNRARARALEARLSKRH
jgi:hypothetical protein